MVEAAVAAVVSARRSELNSIVKRNTETVHIDDEVKITFFYIFHFYLCISALVESGADMKMVYLIVHIFYVKFGFLPTSIPTIQPVSKETSILSQL